MQPPIHINVLREVSKFGIGKPVNISPILAKYFDKPITNSEVAYNREIRQIYLFVNDLSRMGYIYFDGETDSNPDFMYLQWKPINLQWLDSVALEYYITAKGLDYLEQYETNKQNKYSGLAIIANLVVSFVLSLLTVIITWKTLIVSDKSFDEAKANTKTLTKVEKRLDTLSTQLRKLIPPSK